MNYGNAYFSYANKYIGNVILTFITFSFCDNIVVQYERNDMGDSASKRNRIISFLITAIIRSLCVIFTYHDKKQRLFMKSKGRWNARHLSAFFVQVNRVSSL